MDERTRKRIDKLYGIINSTEGKVETHYERGEYWGTTDGGSRGDIHDVYGSVPVEVFVPKHSKSEKDAARLELWEMSHPVKAKFRDAGLRAIGLASFIGVGYGIYKLYQYFSE